MSLTDDAITNIRRLIVSGQLQPGSRLPPEQQLADDLGLSRSSMREAVRALVLARVLDVRRGDGTYVTSLEPKLLLDGLGFAFELLQDRSLLEVMEVRRLLEPGATALAAARIDHEHLERLEMLLSRMRDASDGEQLVKDDADFHDTVSAAANNESLRSILNGLSSRTLRVRVWRSIIEADAARETIAQHEAIYHALRVRDIALAEATALLHVAATETWLRTKIDESQSSSPQVAPSGEED